MTFNEACPEGQDEIPARCPASSGSRPFNEACPEGQDEMARPVIGAAK